MDNDNRPGQEKQGPDLAFFSLLTGIFGLLSLCFFLGFPGAILLGVAAVGLSILSRNLSPDTLRGGPGRFSRTAVIGMVFGFASVLMGIAEFAYLIYFNQLLKDPETANYIAELYSQYQAILNR